MQVKKRYIPRELSWLSFNRRVLQEAENPNTPLLERLRFLGIFSNNLDEFFRVRVGTLHRLLTLKNVQEHYGENPAEVLDQINQIAVRYQKSFEQAYNNIVAELRQNNLHLVNEAELTAEQREYVRSHFLVHLLNSVSPIMLSQVEHFPTLADKSIYLMVELSKKKTLQKEYSLLEVPTGDISRFVVLPKVGEVKYVMLLDDVIRCCLADIFASLDYDRWQAYTLKITRDADMEVDNDISQGLIEKVRKGIKRRYKGEPVRFVHDSAMPEDMKSYLIEKLHLTEKDTLVAGGRYHNFKDFMKFPNLLGPDFEYRKVEPIALPALDSAKSIFEQIARSDAFLYYPYHSFSYYIRMLREAAIDPAVASIRITLYRVASESKVVRALMNAARNGKKVTAVVELPARFDESANIYWAGRMEEAGVKVVYGTPGLKVHAKMTHITRVENGKSVGYSTMSTGNFHEGNANIYTDFSLLTCDKRITAEVEQVFRFIEQPTQVVQCKSLLFSPLYMRKNITKLIDTEIKNAREGKEAYILIKVNNLVDEGIVEKLYEASAAGVSVQLVVRGMCSLKAGVPKLSENIKAVSIVDRLLEHSRILIFCNGGKPKYYITSADLMRRNLDQRVEVGIPVYDKKIQAFLHHVVEFALKDNVKARILDAEQKNIFVRSRKKPFRSQMELHKLLLQE